MIRNYLVSLPPANATFQSNRNIALRRHVPVSQMAIGRLFINKLKEVTDDYLDNDKEGTGDN